jgi:hypothetical protein
MKNSPLVTMLLIAVCGLSAVVLGLALMCELRFRQVRQLQSVLAAGQNNRNVIAMVINEANEYSKTHPSIDPLLLRFGAKAGQSATPSAAKPAGK